jgi:single-stranded-DNA-specific exonuclease
MLREKIKDHLKEYGFELAKPNRTVYDYVYKKTKSRERAIIPANRYNNLYHIYKYERNTLNKILNTKFLNKIPDIDKASEIIKKHMDNNSLIYQVIDHDTDGITSGVVGHKIFKQIFKYKRYKVMINKRIWKNGINETIVNNLLEIHKKKKIGLIITSDHGSSDGNRIQILKDHGIDVIVTDHHLPSSDNSPLGIADAFVNYKRDDSMFTNDITGTAVIYFTLLYYGLKYNLLKDKDIDEFYNILTYVGLTTISDSVDMGDWVNRKIVKYMLNILNSNRKLDYFWEVVRDQILYGWFIDQEFISFNLIAKLNSPGRLSMPDLSFRLMVADTYTKAKELLEEVEEINEKRKELQNNAIKNLDLELIGNNLTVAYKENISGVQGILASKLMSKNRTDIAFCFTNEQENTISASGRSNNENLSLIEILNRLKHKDYMVRYGGHNLACGLEIKKDSIETFFNDVNEIIETSKKGKSVYKIDDIITEPKQLYKTFMANVAELPFGQHYPQPVYASKFVLVNKRIISKNGNHFLIGTVKLVTDKGLSEENYKILYSIETEEERMKLINNDYNELFIIYNIGLNKYKENRLNITADKIYYL